MPNVMPNLKLSANTAQRKNIRTLLAYMYSILDTPLAEKYDHGDEFTCTVGVAFRSGLFPLMNAEFRDHKNYIDIDHDTSKYGSTSDVIEAVFGYDYRRYIVHGDGPGYVCSFNAGRDQLVAAIKLIEKAYRTTASTATVVTATVKVDDTRTKIQARIKVLNDYLTAAKALGDEYKVASKETVLIAQAEIRGLEKALAL